MSEDNEAQQDELLALTSIYDEEEFQRAGTAQGGEIRLSLELPKDFKLIVKGDETAEHNVSFLPPLVLNFELPENYPSSSAPIFTLSSEWLTKVQLSSLCCCLDKLWEENQSYVILFTWIQFLKEESLSFLGIQSHLEVIRENALAQCDNLSEKPEETDVKTNICQSKLDQRAVVLMDPRADPLLYLLRFDETQRQKVFERKMFCCGVCFVEKLGSNCLCFKECQHVYCKACMTEYFQIQIQDGNVQCLNCPEPNCTSLASPAQVKEVVDKEVFARYDRLLLQGTLDCMADVVYCPRPHCGTPVMVEPEKTMGICLNCQYAFCTLCKLGYHGVSHCKINADKLCTLRDEYLSATSEQKKFMEQRFGKRVIQKAVEESFSEDWLSANCKGCPRCGTNIQKVDGCNKMTCTSCKQYFCWLCLGVLSRVNPYSHFNNSHSPCFNQLFHGIDLDENFWSDEED